MKKRSIVVNSQQAMNHVNSFCEGKIVLVNFNCLDDKFASNLKNTYIFFDTLLDANIQLNMIDWRVFEKEKTCEYKGNIYSVRDNSAIMRHP